MRCKYATECVLWLCQRAFGSMRATEYALREDVSLRWTSGWAHRCVRCASNQVCISMQGHSTVHEQTKTGNRRIPMIKPIMSTATSNAGCDFCARTRTIGCVCTPDASKVAEISFLEVVVMTDEAVQQAIAAYPQRKARTTRFTLGAPRSAKVIGDGSQALFLRSQGPEDPVNCLWLSTVDESGDHHELLLADPHALLASIEHPLGSSSSPDQDDSIPDEEKARRERARESAQGIVSYSVSADGKRVVFTVGGHLWMTELRSSQEHIEHSASLSAGSSGRSESISTSSESRSETEPETAKEAQSHSTPTTVPTLASALAAHAPAPVAEVLQHTRTRHANKPAAPRMIVDKHGLHAETRELGDTWFVSAMTAAGSHRSRLFRPVLNPRIAPNGHLVAYTTGRMINLIVIGENGQPDDERCVCGVDDNADITVGLAEFIAGEEMDRYDGFWWSPDSRSLLITRVDESPEPRWFIADPANPTSPATGRRYPQALTNNAEVRLFRFDVGEAERRAGNMAYASIDDLPEVWWDRRGYEYLASVSWSRGGDPLIAVQNRRQTALQVLRIAAEGSDPNVGYASVESVLDGFTIQETGYSDGNNKRWLPTETLEVQGSRYWLDLIHGVPAWTPDGRLITSMMDEEADASRLAVNGKAFTPAEWQILEVLHVSDHDVLARATRDPRCVDVVSFPLPAVNETSTAAAAQPRVLNPEPGVWTASRQGEGLVLSGRTMDSAQAIMQHRINSHSAVIANHAATPGFAPNTFFTELGPNHLRAAITLPSVGSAYAHADTLPVLMTPYGGPMHREAMLSQAYHWDSQWWADQGFIVVAADGRGTGARGLRWDHAMFEHFDLALDDQIDAVRALPDALDPSHSAAAYAVVSRMGDAEAQTQSRHDDNDHAELSQSIPSSSPAPALPRPDLNRVAIIGWSFGGYLSALAAIRAPEVFRAACAGAPPTDWTLYDTHYTERYLGMSPEVYEANSLIADAPKLRRPLMLIHGFADDNVTVANTLRLSSALLAAGREHTVLPLTGITHMTNDPTVAENLLLLQRDFLRDALA